MNYRHAFHAGNHADVLKHAVLTHVLSHLAKKDNAFRVIDTHAGTGVYDLAGLQATRTQEWQGGIGKIFADIPGGALGTFLAPYLGIIRALNPDGRLRFYPGSPEIARRLTRPQDAIILCERHPEDAALLRESMRDRRVKVLEMDGWTGLRANVPPKERRGAVLIDPPFEQPGELQRLARALSDAVRRWRTGTYLLWYPVKDPIEIDAFASSLARQDLPETLRIEFWLRRPRDRTRLNGSGLIVVNPPWTLAGTLGGCLAELVQFLGEGEGGRSRCEQIIPERC